MIRISRYTISGLALLAGICLLAAMPLLAQDSDVTADDVNEIAGKLYCPVCENIPLDTCGTAACEDWRYEIQLQLEDGLSEQEIIDDFVVRFGDRVVGVPQDPLLRTMSLLTPVILVLAGLVIAGLTLFNLRKNQVSETESPAKGVPLEAVDDYRTRMEQDLMG